MRTVAVVATFALLFSSPVYGEEICFSLSVGTRILQDIEDLAVCRDAVDAGTQAINSCEVRASVLENRVSEQDREIIEGKKTVEETRKAGEEAAKIASGPWYQKVLNAVKWIALGIVIGFVGGMSK
jgi:hypothetical protein